MNELDRAQARAIYFQEAIEYAIETGESTNHLEEKLFAALTLAELYESA